MLGQCLGQDERARDDLAQFVSITRSEQGQSSLLTDAERRLVRLDAGRAEGVRVPPARSVGLALLGGGAGLAAFGGVLHGATWQEAQLTWGADGWSSGAGLGEPAWERLQEQNRAGFVVLAAGGAVAVAGAVSALSTAGRRGATAWLIPTDGGVLFGVAGRF